MVTTDTETIMSHRSTHSYWRGAHLLSPESGQTCPPGPCASVRHTVCRLGDSLAWRMKRPSAKGPGLVGAAGWRNTQTVVQLARGTSRVLCFSVGMLPKTDTRDAPAMGSPDRRERVRTLSDFKRSLRRGAFWPTACPRPSRPFLASRAAATGPSFGPGGRNCWDRVQRAASPRLSPSVVPQYIWNIR